MARMQLHQYIESMALGDATSDQVLAIRRWLREAGFDSEIYAVDCEKALTGQVRPATLASVARDRIAIFHHTIGSSLLERLRRAGVPLILIYHNVTPSHFFAGFDPALVGRLQAGRRQLPAIRSQTLLALGASPFSTAELQHLGFERTGVLPIVLDESRYSGAVDPGLRRELRAQGRHLLFVGRLAPNKRQEDLFKLLYYLRRIETGARLLLVGSLQAREYVSWLRHLAQEMNLAEAVVFTGHVSQEQLVAYYRGADLFVSMSEHEGFGKPLVESMYFGLPVLAYASAAVPSTLGGAGLLFYRKEYEALAELASMVIQDEGLRGRLVEGQSRRVQAFLEPAVRRLWLGYLEELGLL